MDINLLLSIRNADGGQITRAQVVKALMALIVSWEENEEAFSERIYANLSVEMVVGVGEDVRLFGIMFSDKWAVRRVRELSEAAAKSDNLPDNIEAYLEELLKHKD